MDIQNTYPEYDDWLKTNMQKLFESVEHLPKEDVRDIIEVAGRSIWQAAQAVPEGFVLVEDKPIAYMVQNKFWKDEFEVKLLNEMPELEFEGDSYDIEIPLYAAEAQEQKG